MALQKSSLDAAFDLGENVGRSGGRRGVWNAVLTACGCVDATNLVVVVATSFVAAGSVMKRSKIVGVSGKFSSGEQAC